MSMLPADWSEQYAAWVVQARPHLQARDYQAAFANYPYPGFADAPWTEPTKHLKQARVALVSAAGITVSGQAPFDDAHLEGDHSFRWFAGCGPLSNWQIHHPHYDHASAEQDYNTVFPLDIMRQLQMLGEIGSVAPRQVSFMGYVLDAAAWLNHSVPAIAEGLKDDGVDAALLVPV